VVERLLAPLEKRIGVRLRRAEAIKVLRQMVVALTPVAIPPAALHHDALDAAVVLPGEDGALELVHFEAAIVPFARGGHRVVLTHRVAARLSVHAQERLHWRLSTAQFAVCARELEVLRHAPSLARIGRALGLKYVEVPSPSGAFVLALDESVPRVVTFVDDLNAAREPLLEPIREYLARRDVAALTAKLAHPTYDRWRRARRDANGAALCGRAA
jgi:hypothetical protein